MKRIIIATKNKGKVAEFKQIFQKHSITVQSLLDFPDVIDVEETGVTFAENAAIKAETIAKQLGEPVIADDSGLVVDMLDGRPGIYSARYASNEKDDEANIDKVLRELKGITEGKRTAHFQCVLAIAFPVVGETVFVEGSCEGMITYERKGSGGFGYDPIFYVPEKEKTMAEISRQEKNELSHRAVALKKLENKWDVVFGGKQDEGTHCE